MTDYQDNEKRQLEYRNAGIALTVTVTAFSVGLLSWSISKGSMPSDTLHITQLISCSITILFSVLAQLSLFQGYKYQTKSLQEGESYRRNNNYSRHWFKILDWSIEFSVLLLSISFILTVILWWPY